MVAFAPHLDCGRSRLVRRLCVVALVISGMVASLPAADDGQSKPVRSPTRPPAGQARKANPRPAVPPGDLGTIVSWLTGDFSNRAQAPLTGITPGGSEKQPQDRVHAHLRRAIAPGVGDVVLYLQWNRDRADGPIARQRLWSLTVEGGSPVLRIYAFVDAEPYVDALESPDILETLTVEDLVVPDATCVLSFSKSGDGFTATTLPACTASWRGGRQIRLQIRLRVTSEGFTYSEAGYVDPDFTQVFALPSKGGYEFLRSKP